MCNFVVVFCIHVCIQDVSGRIMTLTFVAISYHKLCPTVKSDKGSE